MINYNSTEVLTIPRRRDILHKSYNNMPLSFIVFFIRAPI